VLTPRCGRRKSASTSSSICLVLAVQFHVRVACRHTARDAAKLRPYNLIVVGGPISVSSFVELGGDWPVNERDAQDHL